jgi:hypothetical protein
MNLWRDIMNACYSDEMMEKYLDMSENFSLKWFSAFDNDPFLSDPNVWDLLKNLWRHRNRYVNRTEAIQVFMPRVGNRIGAELLETAYEKNLIEIVDDPRVKTKEGKESKHKIVRMTNDCQERFAQGISTIMKERQEFFRRLPDPEEPPLNP